MDIKSNKPSSILADPAPINKSRLSIRSTLLPCSQSGSSFSPSNVLPRKKPAGKSLDDVRSNGWLDAMKASSPPRRKILKDFNHEVSSDYDSVAVYNSWMHKYPSALNSFEQIITPATKKIVMFLDYDGTLSPIVDDPDLAFISPDMRSAVRNVAKYFPTAIISGRRREKVYELVGLTELYYAGSHGMDIMFPVGDGQSTNRKISTNSTDQQQDKEVNLFQPARDFLSVIDEVFRTLVENTKDIKGAKVEHHKFCAAVHYRKVDEKNWSMIAQIVYYILEEYPRLQVTHGRKVLEIRPVIDWDKGKAVQFVLKSLGLSNKGGVLPIFIGDDKTDEDAFKVLREENQGLGILVSPIPKESHAAFSLRDPSEVQEFLKSLVRWKEQTCRSGSTM